MTGLDDAEGGEVSGADASVAVPADGRNARRERNVNRVLDVVMEMFGEDALFPTMDQVAERSGLSLRSLYRYFPDPSALVHAAIERHQIRANAVAHLPSMGQGPLAERIDDFVAMRLRLYEQFGPSFRASRANAHRHVEVAEVIVDRRQQMRVQFEHQFAPELTGPEAEREVLIHVGNTLTQLDTLDLMDAQGQSSDQIRTALVRGLSALFAS